eukprot:CAMPEP_0167745040 /NCGR_PEP_ID=MMETSP0110_2-20121227/2929_1 /TAXON_ID=629695 /ORGANISM="Gymnochlora sp., Strain CCMP2014" /LENGTH=555 /DNA_ID=CAMNT_0007629635 /DNA_START=211 /DNA_END=1874 /DNA_ORIENTATION=+
MTTYVHPYYCKCDDGWIGDDCSTRIDSFLSWFLSKGKAEFPPCCLTCGAQYDIPFDWSTMASDLNPYSPDRCHRFGWFNKWDSDHGYMRATGPDASGEERECFDRFRVRHWGFFKRRGLQGTPWLDFGSAKREMEGVPMLTYDEDYNSFLEIKNLLEQHLPENAFDTIGDSEVQGEDLKKENEDIHVHWIHSRNLKGKALHDAATKRVLAAVGRTGHATHEIKISPHKDPHLWDQLMFRFREKVSANTQANEKIGTLNKARKDFPCCVYCAPNTTQKVDEEFMSNGYDEKTHHKIRRETSRWWKSPAILPSNYMYNRRGDEKKGCCEVCPGVSLGPHYYNITPEEDYFTERKFNASYPFLSLLEEDASIWWEEEDDPEYAPEVLLETDADSSALPYRKYDKMGTDWKEWDKHNPHRKRRKMRQVRRLPQDPDRLPRSFSRPEMPVNSELLPRWGQRRARYHMSPCLLAQRFQLRSSQDVCHSKGDCCNICPSQFWIQSRVLGYDDDPFSNLKKVRKDDFGWFLSETGTTNSERPHNKNEIRPKDQEDSKEPEGQA